jgi:hypothetical protein
MRMTIGLGETIAVHDRHPTEVNKLLSPLLQSNGIDPLTGEIAPDPIAERGSEVSTRAVTIPADAHGAVAALQQLFADARGLVLVPNDPVAPTAFWVGYRPRLNGVAPVQPTAEEMRAKRATTKQRMEDTSNAIVDPATVTVTQ